MSELGVWGEGPVWLIGGLVCLLAAPWVQLFSSMGIEWSLRSNQLPLPRLLSVSGHELDCSNSSRSRSVVVVVVVV